jgi:hypothetical protein
VSQLLSRAVQGKSGWNEVSTYDAAWIAMNAYAYTGPDAGYQDLWPLINNPYGAAGIGGIYVVDTNHDQSLSSYLFYSVQNSSYGPVWVPVAGYRDVMSARDELELFTS